VSGSSFLIHRARTSRFLLSSQTKPFCAIKNALLHPARWRFTIMDTASTPQQASLVQRRRSQLLPPRSSKCKCHSRCARRSPSPTTAIRASSSPTKQPSNYETSPANRRIHPARKRARRRRRRALSRLGRDVQRRRVDVRARATHGCAGHSPPLPPPRPPVSPVSHPFRFGAGPYRHAAGHVREQ
jgi:hypothetical protein